MNPNLKICKNKNKKLNDITKNKIGVKNILAIIPTKGIIPK